MIQPIVDPEFQGLIPPLQADEYEQLEQSIKRDGCIDPLIVWAGQGILLDGHNRLELCRKHGVSFNVKEIELPDRIAARIWIRTHQLGRRNLTPAWRVELQLGNKNDLAETGRARQSHGLTAPGRTLLSPNDKSVPEPTRHDTRAEIAKAAQVSTGTVAQAEIVKRESPDLWEKAKAGAETIGGAYRQVQRARKEQVREARREQNRQQVAIVQDPIDGSVKYATIVLDPPWDWSDEGDVDQLGRARPDYATLTIDQLRELPVGAVSDDDCHLYMWITNRSLPKGFDLLESWGFRYVTMLTWPKPSFGMGNYFRGQTEHVLFGVRGSQMLKRKDASTLLPPWRRGPHGHSSKPVEFYQHIESCSPGPYLEMFARSRRDGWSSWGADAN